MRSPGARKTGDAARKEFRLLTVWANHCLPTIAAPVRIGVFASWGRVTRCDAMLRIC